MSVFFAHSTTCSHTVLTLLKTLYPLDDRRQHSFHVFHFFERRFTSQGQTGVLTNRSVASVKPRIAARFSVPARRSFSCPPPNRMGSGNSGERTKSAPAPFGPWNLWAQTDTRSALNW